MAFGHFSFLGLVVEFGVEAGSSARRRSHFCLRAKVTKRALNTCGKTLFAPWALRSDSLPQVSLEEV